MRLPTASARPFEQAVGLILDCKGKLIVSGLGKSGHVARKIAATFASTGTTATFLHLAEAIHGDLGMAAARRRRDPDFAERRDGRAGAGHRPFRAQSASRSSRSPAMRGSMLAEAAAAALVLPHWPEVGPESVAPTTSTTMTLALGDALAMTVMRQKGFTRTDFGRLHPGRLARRAAEAGPPADAFGGEALPLTRADSIDARHDRRDVGQAAWRRSAWSTTTAISSA